MAAVGLGLLWTVGAWGAQPNQSTAGLPAGAEIAMAQHADPGPRPRREDFATDEEFVLAYLRWLYICGGGDPADLDGASMIAQAKLVQILYESIAGNSLDPNLLKDVSVAASDLLEIANGDKLPIPERTALLEMVEAVQAVAGSASQ